jgi:hypothetical protein
LRASWGGPINVPQKSRLELPLAERFESVFLGFFGQTWLEKQE